MALFSTIAYFPFVLNFCCFVSFRVPFNLRHFFRYARAYVRTGSYAPERGVESVRKYKNNWIYQLSC